jgi:hypothetical protein
MNVTITNRQTSAIAVGVIFNGFMLFVTASIFGLRLALLLGVMLMGIGLFNFPSILVAVMFGGYYLYFLVLERIGINPYTNLTAMYLACQNGLTILSLLFHRYRTGNPPRMLNSNTGMFALFVGYILAQYFLFSNTQGATKKLGFLVIQVIPAFLVGSLLDRQVALRSFKIAFGFAFFLGVYTIFKVPWGAKVIRFTGITGWNALAQPYVLSAGAILVICFYFFRPTGRRLSLILYLALFVSYLIVFFINCILAASRGPVLSFVMVGIVMSIYFWRKRTLKVQHAFALILVTVLLIPIWDKIGDVFTRNVVRIKQTLQLVEVVQGKVATVETASSIRVRFMLIQEQFSGFAKNPILGIGFGNGWESYMYVHNAFLEVLFETGFIGALLFIGIIHKVGKRIFRIWKSSRIFNAQDSLLVTIAFLWLYFVIVGFFSGSLFDNLSFWFFSGAMLNLFVGKSENYVPDG